MTLRVRRRVIAGAVTAVPTLIILGSFVAPTAPRVAASTVASQTVATASGGTSTCIGTPTPTLVSGLPTPTLCIATPTATPTVLPTNVPTPSLVPTSTPTPVPTPTLPGGTQSPGPTATPGPGGSGSGNSTGGSGSGGSTTTTNTSGTAGGGSTTASSAGGTSGPLTNPASWPKSIAGNLVITDPLLADQIEQVLANPVAAQRPDLVHFTLAAATSILPGPGSSGGVGTFQLPLNLPPSVAGALLLVALLSGLIILAVHAQWRRLGVALVLVPAALAVPVSAAAAMLLAQPVVPQTVQVRTAPAEQTPAPAGVPLAQTSQDVIGGILSAESSTSVPAVWKQLVAIENAIAQQNQAISADEQEIASLTAELGPAPAAAVKPHQFRASGTSLKALLQQAVQAHQAELITYQHSLQAEYNFFVSVAQSPTEAAQLRSSAAAASAGIERAVVYDLAVVQTQLQQQATIAAALAHESAFQGQVPRSGPITFHAPVSGIVTQGFGPTSFALEPPVTYMGVFYPHFHTGIDIAAPLDTPVGAAANGVVIFAGSSRDAAGNLVGYGNYVVIQHADGFVTLYGHLEQVVVHAGQPVLQGEVIGLVGSTGWSTGPHVHFEIRLNGIWVNPAPYLAGQIVS